MVCAEDGYKTTRRRRRRRRGSNALKKKQPEQSANTLGGNVPHGKHRFPDASLEKRGRYVN